MADTPTFTNPPIVELVLGAQFSPLTKLSAGHYGMFWQELGEQWHEPTDGPVLDDQFELFDRPRWRAPTRLKLRLEPIRFPGRFTLHHVSGDRLVQIQPTRFHLNWRKQEGFYPSYKNLIAEFEATFAQFTAFVEKAGIGQVAVNQWEITYVDAFAQGAEWQTPADWPSILPGLFGSLFPTHELGLSLENRVAEWSYEIEPKRGRLHIAAHPGRYGEEKQDMLLLNMTARGPVGKEGVATLREGLDLGHQMAVGAFLRLTSEQAQQSWGTKP